MVESYTHEVRVYTNTVYDVIRSIDLYDYSDVKALSDEGYELINKLRWSVHRFKRLASFGGKYAYIFREILREREALLKELMESISDLWDAWKEYLREEREDEYYGNY